MTSVTADCIRQPPHALRTLMLRSPRSRDVDGSNVGCTLSVHSPFKLQSASVLHGTPLADMTARVDASASDKRHRWEVATC